MPIPSNEKSRSPSGSSASEEGSSSSSEDSNKMTMSQEFPFGPAFKVAMGRVTAFPDGSEAVMIDSALALEAFQQDFQMVIEFMSMHKSPILICALLQHEGLFMTTHIVSCCCS